MQIDTAERGFSFQKDGPLDMRMGDTGPTAADLVNTLDEGELADILYLYGEEHASRRIARAIVAARPVTRTLELAGIIARCLPRAKPGQSNPATRSFQALRIAVNDEYGELAAALAAAERALKPGGLLAVVTFHSVEDRMVKRFLQLGAEAGGSGNRYAPAAQIAQPRWEIVTKKAAGADEAELAANPRARSARLRVGRRTAAPCATGGQRGIGDAATQGGQTVKGLAIVLAALAVMGLGFWAYQENYRTQGALREVRDMQASIGAAHARLRMLNAEWAYLNRPDRLQDLVDLNFERLGLVPLSPEAFGQINQVAVPPEPIAPLTGNIIDPVDVAFEQDPNVEPL